MQLKIQCSDMNFLKRGFKTIQYETNLLWKSVLPGTCITRVDLLTWKTKTMRSDQKTQSVNCIFHIFSKVLFRYFFLEISERCWLAWWLVPSRWWLDRAAAAQRQFGGKTLPSGTGTTILAQPVFGFSAFLKFWLLHFWESDRHQNLTKAQKIWPVRFFLLH